MFCDPLNAGIHQFAWCIEVHSLWWRHNDHTGVSNHQPPGCLLNRLFRRKSKKTSKLRVTGLCAENSPGTGEFSAQMASYAENVSIWWRHHVSFNMSMPSFYESVFSTARYTPRIIIIKFLVVWCGLLLVDYTHISWNSGNTTIV